jgi:ABC-type bacteriocin/lantibiotic exporter with double-glycine peptidase domain
MAQNQFYNSFSRFIDLLKPEKREIGIIYLYAIFAGILNLSLPLGIQAIIGFVMAGMVSTSWIILVIIVVIGVALAGGLQIMQLYITEILQQRIFTRSSFEFAFRIPKFKMEALRNYYPPELINRFFDTISVQKGLSKILIEFSSSVLQIFFGLVLLSFYHPFFVVFAFVVLGLIFLIINYTGPRGLATSLKESKHKYEVAHWLEELGRVMGTFKLAGDSSMPLSKTDDLVSKYLTARKNHFSVLLLQYGSIVGFKVLITASLLILGGILVIDQQINIGQFVAAEIIIILVLNSVEKLLLSMESVYDVLTSLEKINSVVNLPIETNEGICFDDLDQGDGFSISIKNLTYRYSDRALPVINNFNLDIKPGDRICITGYNNSGKTTLLNLISGLFTDYQGEILYNKVPLLNLNMQSMRQHIGDILSQEQIFAGTLSENISMLRDGITFKKVKEAAEQIGLDSFIQQLPQGYDTQLIAEGKGLPRSVAMKLIIARAAVDKPRLLVLEEFLHNIERKDRVKISKFLTDKSKPWTLVAVSNDPVFAASCDKVIVMKEGEIMAIGDYESLKDKEFFGDVCNLN